MPKSLRFEVRSGLILWVWDGIHPMQSISEFITNTMTFEINYDTEVGRYKCCSEEKNTFYLRVHLISDGG